jgi:hypothetical protein
MPLTIAITINQREVLHIDCYNGGSPTGDHEIPTRCYCYTAIHRESGKTTAGEVLHERPEGIEKLAAIVLSDIATKINSFR